MADKNLISLLSVASGIQGWIHDASAIHGIKPADGSTADSFIVTVADPASSHSFTFSLNMPAGIARKSDIQAVMNYRGSVSSKDDIQGKTPTAGDVYVASQAFNYGTAEAPIMIEAGDMFVGNGNSFDIIQTNIDPSKYAAKGHVHTSTVSGTTAETTITPSGTISVAVEGKTTTFSGTYTPAGGVTVGTFTYTTTAVTATNGMTLSKDTHSHTFSGKEATISMSYDKADANTGTSEAAAVTGTISVSHSLTTAVSATLSTESATGSVTIADHSHSFNGSLTTFTGSFTPDGTISKPDIDYTVSTSSISSYATGEKTLTSAAVSVTGFSDSTVVSGATYSSLTEILELTWSSVAVSAESATSYLTDITLTTSSQDIVTGFSSIALHAAPSFTGTEATVSVSGTPSGTIGVKEGLTGTATYIKATAVNATISVTGDPTVTFSLSAAGHSHSIGSTATTISATYTPEGTISEYTHSHSFNGSITLEYDKLTGASGAFSGKEATINVSGTPLLNAPTATFYGAASTHSHTFSVTTVSSTESIPA